MWFVSCFLFFFSSRRRHTRFSRDWSSDVCSSDLVGLVDLCGELGGEDVVQALTVGVLVEGGGVSEDAGAAGLGGGLGEDRDLAVDVDDEDGQVAEVGFGEGVDVVGGDEVHDPVLPVGPWGCSPGRVSGAVPLTS